MDEDEVFFRPTKITCRPIMVCDVKELFDQLDKAYEYLETCEPDVRRLLGPLLNIACDEACSLTYQLGFEYPQDIADNTCYHYVIKDLFDKDK